MLKNGSVRVNFEASLDFGAEHQYSHENGGLVAGERRGLPITNDLYIQPSKA